ncbi:MAG TPA: amino acid permease, partial [Pyrinomonadaceae bacterium]|nr:amino acid permease [Pyrinomonadaceae bacterium]
MQTQPQLKRQIGLRTATALIVGEIIAVGIFLTPAGMAKSLGSPTWLLVVWLVMGALSLCGALCFGELAVRFPEAGGGYAYLREAYGPALAFLYGWMALLVMDPGLTAAIATGAASYVGYGLQLSARGNKLVAIAAIITLALVNIRGVRLGAWFVRWLTVLKVGFLAFIALWAFGFQMGHWSNFVPLVAQRPGSKPLIEALAVGVGGSFFSFAGWWDLSKVAGEVRNPSRTMPRAFVYGILIVTMVYVLTSAAFVYLVPMEQVTNGQAFAAQVGEVLFGRTGAQVFSAFVIIAVLGSLAPIIMSAPRVYFAMARDGLFFPAAAAIHPRFNTPARCIALQAVLASVLVLSGTFDEIVSYFFFVVLVFIALTVFGVFVLRRRKSSAVEYSTPGYPVTPIIFLLLVLLMLILFGVGEPKRSFLGVGVVTLGVPVYYLLFRRRR